MRTTRLGCISGSGIIITLLALLAIGVVAATQGGVLFNPGALNEQSGNQPLGGVSSHADTGGRCSACHTAFWQADTMSDRCLVCHQELLLASKDFHTVMLAQNQIWECRSCHTDHNGPQAALTILDLNRFPHEAAGYSLKGHQITSAGTPFNCSDCHGEQIGAIDLAVCADCHQEIDKLYMEDHLAAFGVDCLTCHDGLDTYGEAFDHNQQAFPLQGGHASASCSQCHTGARSISDLQTTGQTCTDCHTDDDAHGGAFGQDCSQCHTPETWEGAEFDHSLAAFQLTGAHRQVACESCHLDGVFRGTPQDCFSCHAADDEHLGAFGQDCAQCHTPETWEGAEFDHSLAAFQLTGAHQQVACEACHLDGVFRGTPQDCFSCHAADDEHQGAFGQDCAQCHTTETWEGAEFDHSLAAFQLTGAHQQVACESCHLNGVFRGTPQDCSGCHSDPPYHLGLFGNDCATCHTTDAWLPALFDRSHTFPFNHGESGISDCRTCHTDTLAVYTCYTCHEHSQGEIERKHREEGISDFQDCARCHPTGREEEGEGREGGDD